VSQFLFPLIAASSFASVCLLARFSRSQIAIVALACFAGFACGALLTTLAVVPVLVGERNQTAMFLRTVPLGAFFCAGLGGAQGLILVYLPSRYAPDSQSRTRSPIRFTIRALFAVTTVVAVLLSATVGHASLVGPPIFVSLLGIGGGILVQRDLNSQRMRGALFGVTACWMLYVLSLGPVAFLLVNRGLGPYQSAVVSLYRPLIRIGGCRPFQLGYETYLGSWLNLQPSEVRGWSANFLEREHSSLAGEGIGQR
jgi:hypothetical protein